MLELWQRVVTYFWRPELPWALGMTLAMALVVLRFLPSERRLILNAVELYGFCFFGKFVSAWIEAFGFHTEAEVVHELFVVGSGLIMIHMMGLLLFRLILPLLRLRTPEIIEDLLIFLGYITWILVRLRLAGMEPAGLVTTSALLTAVVAFSMQDTLGNTLGGLLLQLESSIRVGDWITVNAVSGRIAEIRWRYTAVETRNGETVIFPNSVLMKNPFTVVSSPTQRRPQWRRWIWFNVPSATPAGRVVESALAALAAGDIPNVAREPEPSCVLMEFGPGFARYALRYWLVDPGIDDPTDSRVRMQLFAGLERAGIQFAVADHAVQMVTNPEKLRKQGLARERERRLAVLRSIDLFAGLTPEELSIIAERLVYAPFANGDVLVRQGSVGDWLYLLAEGEVDVWLETTGSARRHLMTLGPGVVLSATGLMTGEPRRATLIAKTYAQCYRLDKAVFEQVIHSRPDIAEEIARLLATRERRLRELEDDTDVTEPTTPTELSLSTQSILKKMRDFLGFDQRG